MLSFERPDSLCFLFFLIPVIALYFLRQRYRRSPIGSAFLWKRVAESSRGGGKRAPRSLLLLLLQILAVIFASFSLALPAWTRTSLAKPGTAFLVDVSASMGVASSALGDSSSIGAGTRRLDVAVAEAIKRVNSLPVDTPLAVFALGSSTRPVYGPGFDRGAAISALSSLEVGDGALSEDSAFLVLGSWLSTRSEAWQAELYSDGGLDAGGRKIAAAFEGALVAFSFGKPEAPWVGIAGISLELGGARLEASIVSGGGGFPTKGIFALRRNGALVASAERAIPEGSSKIRIDLPSPAAAGGYELELEGLNWSGAKRRIALGPAAAPRVLLVGEGNAYLRAALVGLGGGGYSRAETLPADFDASEWDLVFFDGRSRKGGETAYDWTLYEKINYDNIAAGLVVFGAFSAGSRLDFAGERSGRLEAVDSGHPLSRFIEWREISANGAAVWVPAGRESLDRGDEAYLGSLRASVTAGATSRVESVAAIGGATVIAAWESPNGFGRVLVGVDLEASDFGLSAVFPVFLGNVSDFCAPGADEGDYANSSIGEDATIPSLRGFRVEGLEPSEWTRTRNRIVVMPMKAGLYSWASDTRNGMMAFNVPPQECKAAARALPAMGEPPLLVATPLKITIELYAYFAAAFAMTLAAEWFVFRGISTRNGMSRGLDDAQA